MELQRRVVHQREPHVLARYHPDPRVVARRDHQQHRLRMPRRRAVERPQHQPRHVRPRRPVARRVHVPHEPLLPQQPQPGLLRQQQPQQGEVFARQRPLQRVAAEQRAAAFALALLAAALLVRHRPERHPDFLDQPRRLEQLNPLIRPEQLRHQPAGGGGHRRRRVRRQRHLGEGQRPRHRRLGPEKPQQPPHHLGRRGALQLPPPQALRLPHKLGNHVPPPQHGVAALEHARLLRQLHQPPLLGRRPLAPHPARAQVEATRQLGIPLGEFAVGVGPLAPGPSGRPRGLVHRLAQFGQLQRLEIAQQPLPLRRLVHPRPRHPPAQRVDRQRLPRRQHAGPQVHQIRLHRGQAHERPPAPAPAPALRTRSTIDLVTMNLSSLLHATFSSALLSPACSNASSITAR